MADPRLCIDTDALVNLLALGCLDEALACLGLQSEQCYRLPSVPAQVRRAKWVGERWPQADRGAMEKVVDRIPSLPPSQDLGLQGILNEIPDIHEGDAYLISAVAEDPRRLLLTGDGNMLRALSRSSDPAVRAVCESLQGRVLIFPQIIASVVRVVTLAELEIRWRAACPLGSKRQKSLHVMFGTTSPTKAEDFWGGYQLQLSNVTEICGPQFLYSLEIPL